MTRCRKCGRELAKESAPCSWCGVTAKKRSSLPAVVIVVSSVVCVVCSAILVLWKLGLIGPGSFSDNSSPEGLIGYANGSFVQVNNGAIDEKVTDKDEVLDLLSQIGATLGISDVGEQLSSPDVQQALDITFYRFDQRYEGIPVFGRSVILGADPSGEVRGITSNFRALEGVATTPKVGEEKAVKAAVGDAEGATASDASLCIYSFGDAEPTLAWELVVSNGFALTRVFINAQDGSVLAEESLVSRATLDVTTADGSSGAINVKEQGDSTYVLVDDERNLRVYDAREGTASCAGGTVIDEQGKRYSLTVDGDKWMLTDDRGGVFEYLDDASRGFIRIVDSSGKIVSSQALLTDCSYEVDGTSIHPVADNEAYLTGDDARNAVSLQSYLSDAIDLYELLFERNSFDGAGGKVDGVANVRLLNDEGVENSLNAQTYSFAHTVFIFYGRDLEMSRDVVTHELTHSLERCISSLGVGEGSEGSNGETGSLREAICDIVAMAAEDYANDGSFNNDCDWAMTDSRNLADPLAGFDGRNRSPEKYQGEIWGDPKSEKDGGFAHYNSTVISHAGYLMCMGEAIEGNALTTGQLAQLTYLALFSLPTDCTFSQFRVIMENTAGMMVEQGLLTESQSVRVAESFSAVEIPRTDDLYGATKDATLQVFDINNEPSADYTVTVIPWSWFWRTYQTDDAYTLTPESADPLPLNFPGSGTYRLDITDRNNPHLQWGAQVAVGWLRDETEIKLYTSLGDYEEGSEQSRVAGNLPMDAATPTSGTRDVALVLDVSGSMEGSPIEQMKAAAKEFVGTTLKGQARVGVVFYESEAMVLQGLSSDEQRLMAAVDELAAGGDTNMEDGLVKGGQVVGASDADRQIIVLMSDGAPNRGKTGDDLIAYANLLKDRGAKIYTVGFNEGPDGYALLSAIASEGCHYEVRGEEDLVGFFSDIADEINGTRFMYVRAACPVDVEVTYDGETLSSIQDSQVTRTSFGTLAFEDEVDENGAVTVEDGIKVLRLKEGPPYDIRIAGTGDGEMDYTIGFANAEGDYVDFRSFEGIEISPSTLIDTTAEVSNTTRLVVDEDGDGAMDLVYEAGANERAVQVDNHAVVYATLGGCLAATVALGVSVHSFSRWRRGRREMRRAA